MGGNWHPGQEPVAGYRLIERLGGGGFGEVWKAEAPGGFLVALKAVALAGSAGPVERRALDIIRHIRHPHLIATFGTWQDDTTLVIAMELADKTLLDRFREAVGQGFAGVPEPEIHEHFLDAARAIDFLNEPRHPAGDGALQGIQHRDIKPHNLLLVGGSLKVADYGLARVLEGTQTSHTGSLTPLYAAPEFFDGKTSSQSDQYSLAATYCHMRGGRPPFTGNPVEIMSGHVQRPPDLSMLPAPERAAVARALAKAPKDRWPTCRAFIEAIRAAGPGLDTTVPETRPIWLRGPGNGGRGGARWPAVGAAALLLAAGGGLAIYATRAPGARQVLPPGQPQPGATAEVPKSGADRPGSRPPDPPRAQQPSVAAAPAPSPESLGSKGGPHAARPPDPTPDAPAAVTTAPPPGSIRIGRGEAKSLTISADRTAFDGPVTLHFEGLPEGATPKSAEIPASRRSVDVRLSIPPEAAPGEQHVTVRGAGGAASARRTLTIDVADTAAAHLTIADRFLQKKKYAEARSELDAVIRLEAGSAIAYSKRGFLKRITGDPAGAVADYDKALRLDPKNAYAYLNRAAARNGLKEHAGAVADCGEALKIDPKLVSAYLSRAYARNELKEHDRAIADCDAVLKIDPKNALAYHTRGFARNGLKEYAKAIADLDEALKIDPKNALAYNSRAVAWIGSKEYTKAAADCDAALKIDPKYINAYVNRAAARNKLKEYAKAAADCDAALKIDAKSTNAYLNRAIARNELKEHTGAIADCDAALLVDPKSASAYLNRAIARNKLKEYTKAAADCGEALKIDPDNAGAYFWRAWAWDELEEYAKAIADLDEALKIDPKYTSAYVNRAVARNKLKQYAKAAADCDEALKIDAKLVGAYNSRSVARNGLKEHTKAIADCDEALKIDPRYTSAYVNRAVARNRLKEYAKAIADCDAALKIDPKLVSAYEARSQAYRGKGDTRRAEEDSSAAKKLRKPA